MRNFLCCTQGLQNSDSCFNILFLKVKITSTEAFRVKPVTGFIEPGETGNVIVSLLAGKTNVICCLFVVLVDTNGVLSCCLFNCVLSCC